MRARSRSDTRTLYVEYSRKLLARSSERGFAPIETPIADLASHRRFSSRRSHTEGIRSGRVRRGLAGKETSVERAANERNLGNLGNLPRSDRHCRGNGTDYQLGCTRGGEPCRVPRSLLPFSQPLPLSFSLSSRTRRRGYPTRVRAAPATFAEPVPWPGLDQYARAGAHLGYPGSGRSSGSRADQ